MFGALTEGETASLRKAVEWLKGRGRRRGYVEVRREQNWILARGFWVLDM